MTIACDNTTCHAWNQPVEAHYNKGTDINPPYLLNDTCRVCGDALSHPPININGILNAIAEEFDAYYQPAIIDDQALVHAIVQELRRQYKHEVAIINASLPAVAPF